jgi:hypothetical protein
MSQRTLVALDVVAKLALFGLLVHAIANPELSQYADKAMQWRATTYPIAVLAMPLA